MSFMAIRIILDAGHGGRDSGAVFGERVEKDDNLEMTLAVGRLLEEQGFDAFESEILSRMDQDQVSPISEFSKHIQKAEQRFS